MKRNELLGELHKLLKKCDPMKNTYKKLEGIYWLLESRFKTGEGTLTNGMYLVVSQDQDALLKEIKKKFGVQ